MIEAYPLQWPVAYKRTTNKAHALFQTSFAKARDNVISELQKLKAKDIIISTNVPLKKDGLPYAVPFGSTTVTHDTGIAVYFTLNNQQKVICCDAFITLDDNMQSIAKTVEALRGIDRWKCSDIINQTFTGFAALPEQSSFNQKSIWEILGLSGKPASVDVVHSAYKIKAKKLHPDTGGSAEAFHELRQAYQQILKSYE